MTIDGKKIGEGNPCYVIAELSANHHQSYVNAEALVHAAKEAGADAVKLQTYTADTLTLRSNLPHFQIQHGTLWDGVTLHDLFQKAYTPWEWQPRLKKVADEIGITLFSSPFDPTSVDFLEGMNIPAYKVASFEMIDHGLLSKIASTRKPVIMSTGMATLEEIQESIDVLLKGGAPSIVLLKCTSAYPAPPELMNLRMIPFLQKRFGISVGLSDHTLGISVPVASVSLGACVIEKHMTDERSKGGPDAEFSLEPHEFKAMVEAVRIAEKSLGGINTELTSQEKSSRSFRRSLFAVEDIEEGEVFTEKNVRSIRPAAGLAPKHLPEVLGKKANQKIPRGTPFAWDFIQK